MIKGLLSFLDELRHSRLFWGIGLLLMGQVGLTTLFPYLLGRILDQLLIEGAFWQLLLQLGALILLNTFLQWVTPPLYNSLVETYVSELRQTAMTKTFRLPIAVLDKYGQGDVLNRLTVDSQQLSQGMILLFSQFLPGVMTLVLTLAMMAYMNGWLVLLVVVLTPVSFLLTHRVTASAHRFYQDQGKKRSQMTQFLNEHLQVLPLIQAYGAQEQVSTQFQELSSEYGKSSQSAIFYSSTVNPLTRFVNAVLYALLVVLGSYQLLLGRMTLGQLTSFLTYVNQYTKPFNEISSVFAELQATQVSYHRLLDLINLPEEVDVASSPRPVVEGRVIFEDVSFGYEPDRLLMKHLDLEIPAGSMVGIVGPTGAGKTTLINLLMRFYEPQGGQILLDGQPIQTLKKADFYDHIAVVLQETWLKKATIAENIAYGCPSASHDEIVAAARAANADFFIRQLSKGYDTILDGDQVVLSQGQEQLLAIARVFLKSPQIIIFDEATASLDTLTEQLVQDALLKLMQGRTSFVIAHRLTTVQSANLILVMADGNVVEQGTHDSLLAAEGLYARLWQTATS